MVDFPGLMSVYTKVFDPYNLQKIHLTGQVRFLWAGHPVDYEKNVGGAEDLHFLDRCCR